MIGRQIRLASIIYQSYAVLCVLYTAFRINRIVYSGERQSNSIRARTRALSCGVSGSLGKGEAEKRKRRTRPEERGSRAKEGRDRGRDSHELTRNVRAEHREFMTGVAKRHNIPPLRFSPFGREIASIANVRVKFNI